MEQPMGDNQSELYRFLEQWDDDSTENKRAFVRLKDFLADRNDVTMEFLPRPAITYSLRVGHVNLQKRGMFAMIDVIEGDPRWLSICFYADLVSDPQEKGDMVPGGLQGEDAICFDLEEYDDRALAYVETRLEEAIRAVAGIT